MDIETFVQRYYLESILMISERKGEVRSIDIVNELEFSKPSVSRAVGLLKSGNYLVVDGNGHLILTDSGLSVAQKIYERHLILTKMFMALGVDEAIATDDACRIEHYISDISFEAIKKHFFEKTPSDK